MRGRIVWIWALSLFLVLACGDDDDPAGPPSGGGDSTPARVRLSSTSLTFIAIDDSAQLAATVENASGQPVSATVTWESEDEAVAVVRPTGWVIAKGDGTTNVVAKAGSVSATATVKVDVSGTPAKVTITPGTATLVALEDSVLLTVVVENAHGDAISGVTVTWSSTDEEVVVVRPSGWVVAKADGSAKVVATTGSLADTAEVEVARVPAIIVPDEDRVWVGEGRTETVTAVVQDRNGHEIPGVEVTWTSRDPAIATVTDEGVVTGRRRGGKTEIVAGAGEASTAIPVEVMDQLFYHTPNDGLVIIDEDGTVRSSFGGDVNNRVVQPAWSPDGSKIAYAKRRNIGGTEKTDIFVYDVGSRLDRQLTDTGLDSAPTWSPDGTKIAFISRREPLITPELFVMNATDGSGVTRLTNNSNQDINPVWAPVGNLIAVQRNVSGNYDIIVVDANGGGETTVANNSASEVDPAWFPDGSRVLYRRLDSSGGAGQYFSVRPDGSDVQNHNWGSALGHDNQHASVSPDGRWLSHSTFGFSPTIGAPRWHIYLRLIGGGPNDFSEIDGDLNTDVTMLKWAPAPESDKIAYLRGTDRTSLPYDLIVAKLTIGENGKIIVVEQTKVAELPVNTNVHAFAWRPRPRP